MTVKGALEDYGVVLDPETMEIDKAATEERRKLRPDSLPLFDRGPDFERGEAEWHARRAGSR